MATADDFTGLALDDAWTFVDSVGDCSVSVADSRVSIVVPSGTSHATDNSGNDAPYLYQAIDDDDLDVSAKFDSAPRAGANIRFQGVIAYDSAGTDRVGFIAFSTSTQTSLFAFSNVAGSGVAQLNENLDAAAPSHLRLTRVGDVWTCYTSGDGSTWTQQAQFTVAMTVARAGLMAGNSTDDPAFTARVDWWHVGTPSVPTAPEVERTTVFTDTFTGDNGDAPDAARWVVDSGPGGSATIQDGELRLRHTNAEGSSGALYTVDGKANIGALIKYRFADNDTPPAWLVPGFSAGQTPAVSGGGGAAVEGFGDLYSPDWGYVNELGSENDLARPFRVDESSFADGTYVYETYVQLGAEAAASQTTDRWLRQERLDDLADARGLLRFRTWADGETEPDTWDAEIWDGVHDGPGRLYLSFGNNAASGPATRDAFIDDVTLYELTLAEEATSTTATGKLPAHVLPHTVSVVRPATATDDYGNVTRDYGDAATRTEISAWMQQDRRTEPRDDGRDPLEQRWLLVANHADIQGRDRIEWTDHPTFEVEGPPEPAYTPAGYHHVEATLRVVAG